MKNEFDISLDRRVWNLPRMVQLREALSAEQTRALLAILESMTWSEWNSWFIVNLDSIASYASQEKTQTDRKDLSFDPHQLLVHHGAMFIVGLLFLAKNESFPFELVQRNDQFEYDSFAIAASIKVWDNVEAHCDFGLYWQFDDHAPESPLPFKAQPV